MSGRQGTEARLVVLASGRGSNFEAILDACTSGRLPARITALISDRPEAPALRLAERNGIEPVALDFEAFAGREAYHIALLAELERLAPDLIILAGYMRILPPPIVRRFEYRILNIHPSLLPAFPGLHPQRQAIEYGVTVSGCTVHFVDDGMDTGPIIMQAVVPVFPDDTPERLADRILREEHRLYPQAIAKVLTDRYSIVGRRVVWTDEDRDLHHAAMKG